jgi:hypothetical protein
MSALGQKQTFALQKARKSESLRFGPYLSGLFCALIKQFTNSSGSDESVRADALIAATA